MQRNAVLQVRIDPALRDRLRRLRSERHVNVSDWLRRLISDALDRELPAPPQQPIPGWKPCRLPDGSWGSALSGPAADRLPTRLAGCSIEVTARNGSSWTASVTRVVERSPGRVAVSDSGRPGKQP